jgi:hypothetical protein
MEAGNLARHVLTITEVGAEGSCSCGARPAMRGLVIIMIQARCCQLLPAPQE